MLWQAAKDSSLTELRAELQHSQEEVQRLKSSTKLANKKRDLTNELVVSIRSAAEQVSLLVPLAKMHLVSWWHYCLCLCNVDCLLR